MVNKHRIVGFLIILIILFTSSCNFFFIPQHGRENGNDAQAQIYNLFAYQSGENEVTVQFAWREPVYIDDNDEAVQEAVLVYNEGEALPVRSIPLPPDSGGTEGFDFKDGQYIYSKIIDGLAAGDDIYFSLYPHTRREWLAPLFEKITVRNSIDIPLIADPKQYPADSAFQFYPDGWMHEVFDGNQYFLSNTEFLLLRFDLPDNIRCTQANLVMPIFAGSGSVFPVTFRFVEHIPDTITRLSMIDYNGGSTVAFNSMPVDVTEAVNAAIMYGSDALLIRKDNATVVGPFTHNSIGPPPSEYLQITYQEF